MATPRKERVSKIRLRKPTQTSRRIRAYAMDATLQHAFVARLEEILFCPSRTAGLTAPLDLSLILAPISPFESTNGLDDISAEQERILEQGPDPPGTRPVRGPWPPQSTFPRPSVQYLPPDEWHNWLRQAQYRGTPGDEVTEPAWEPPPSLVSDLLGFDLPRGLQFTDEQDAARRQPSDFANYQNEPELQSLETSWIEALASSGLNDEEQYSFDLGDGIAATGEDRDSYGLVAFLETWRDSRAVPVDNTSMLSAIGAPGGECRDLLRDEVSSRGTDIQGLRWEGIGVSREDAMIARRRFHPSRGRDRMSNLSGFKAQDGARHGDHPYRFRSFASNHRATYSHMQLRNVLTSTGHSDIFYATNDQVLRTSLACANACDPIMDLSRPSNSASSFRITCLAASPPGYDHDIATNHVVFAGGFNGEYAFCDISSEYSSAWHEGYVSHAYNAIVTHVDTFQDRMSGQLKAAFCSNDRKLRTLDVCTARYTAVHEFDHALNCSAMSSDRRLRVIVGDSNEAIIADAESGAGLLTLREHTDHIFACTWSPDGRHVATGAEDGIVAIWDARNWQRPVSTSQCVMSSARSLHFTQDSLLVVAEDDDVVSVYEPKLWQLDQSIGFFGSIAGVTIVNGGSEIVVANSDAAVGGLMSFERVDDEGRSQCLQRHGPDEFSTRQGGGGIGGWSSDFDVMV